MKNNPWDEIDHLMASSSVSEKDGWFTMADFMAKYDCTRSKARTILDNWHTSGLLEMCRANAKDDSRQIKYYRYNQSKNL